MYCHRLEFEEGQNSEHSQEGEVIESSPEIVTMPSRFEKDQEKGFIDVWWLYDDGGEMFHITLGRGGHFTCTKICEWLL